MNCKVLFLGLTFLVGCLSRNQKNTQNEFMEKMSVSVRQVTSGTKNHFFGYIGHAMTIPWNAGGRYIVAMETDFRERMPEPGEFARIILIDTRNKNRHTVIDSTLAWNFQQGTMLYWNPENPETQFFFNDLDPNKRIVFTVLYDIGERRRIKEYRTENPFIANGGVSPKGKWFAGINYVKASRRRKVISYADARNWIVRDDTANPNNDGLFRIDIATGEGKLLVSYHELAGFLKLEHAGTYPLYVHHTLWNRDGDRIFFVVRGPETINGKKYYPNTACLIRADGTGLKHVPFTSHREWGPGKNLVLAGNNGYDLYDVDQSKVVGTFGSKAIFPTPGSDNVMSPDAAFYVGSHKPNEDSCIYTFFRLSDGAFMRSPPINQPEMQDSDIRIDPAPRWNRTSDAILVPGIADNGTRQLFEIRLVKDTVSSIQRGN
jgi:hypothetical protein